MKTQISVEGMILRRSGPHPLLIMCVKAASLLDMLLTMFCDFVAPLCCDQVHQNFCISAFVFCFLPKSKGLSVICTSQFIQPVKMGPTIDQNVYFIAV